MPFRKFQAVVHLFPKAKTKVYNHFSLVLMLVLLLLEPSVDKAEKFGNVICFISEQFKLILNNKQQTWSSIVNVKTQ